MRYKRSYQYLLQEIEDKLLIVHKDFFFKKLFFWEFFFWILSHFSYSLTVQANTFLFQKNFESIFFWNKKVLVYSLTPYTEKANTFLFQKKIESTFFWNKKLLVYSLTHKCHFPRCSPCV